MVTRSFYIEKSIHKPGSDVIMECAVKGQSRGTMNFAVFLNFS